MKGGFYDLHYRRLSWRIRKNPAFLHGNENYQGRYHDYPGRCRNQYFQWSPGSSKKQMLSQLSITLFCIHGNHEMRPTRVVKVDQWGGRTDRKAYRLKDWHGGRVYVEFAFPSILFARDGEVYDLDGIETLVIGGAYSPDKPMRLARGWPWFPDEQPDGRIRKRVEKAIEKGREKWMPC